MNLEGYTPGAVAGGDLLVEDRWVLSRLATVTEQVTESLDRYQYADAARALYEFAWDEFCSFYVEMVKSRLQDPRTRAAAQRVLAHTLDTLLRLLHPMIPFLTEEVWQLLAQVAPERGIDGPQAAAPSAIVAPWPAVAPARKAPQIEAQFARFQEVLRAVREIRTRQNVPQKKQISFSVRCEAAVAELLTPMEPYFEAMAGARATACGPKVSAPALSADTSLPGMEIYVDLADLIDVDAEIARKKDEGAKLEARVAAQEKKLGNESFVQRAPAAVVQKERETLKGLKDQLATVQDALEKLTRSK
jgi:valyl-tRNA synthetase